jgi:tubulin monoglycylase TTLL3/8
VKKALKKRGWVENKDKDSTCFDLKWTLKSKDIDSGHLHDFQIVNHFAKATSITTKVGLTHSLKNLIWFNNIDVDTFYPRCFDLAIPEEFDDFVTDFKATKAQSYLKIYLREIREAFDNQ